MVCTYCGAPTRVSTVPIPTRRAPSRGPLSPAMQDGTTPRPTPSEDRVRFIGRAGERKPKKRPARTAFTPALKGAGALRPLGLTAAEACVTVPN